jgi:hypothetical protein
MANLNPYQARLERARRRKPGDLEETRRRVWGMLCLAYDDVGEALDPEQRRKGMLAFAQLATVYVKTYESSEIEPRLKALEEERTREEKP